MKPESCDHAPYPPPGSRAAARAIKMTSTPSHGLNRTLNANARRARRARVVDRARARSRRRSARHTRARARAIDDERSRTDRRVESERARDLAKRGRANRDDGDARQRQRARGDRDDDGARATRRAMDARENAGGRGKRARGFGWDRRARSGARDAGEEGRGGVGIAARALLSTNPRGGARTGTGEGRARDDGEG